MPVWLKQRHQPKLSKRRQAVETSTPAYQAYPATPPIYRRASPTHQTGSLDSVPSTVQSTSTRLQGTSPYRQSNDLQSHSPLKDPSMTAVEATRCTKSSDAALNKLSKLLGDTSLSDFTIKCNDRDWKVHRFVLTLHSTVLQAACTHGFWEEKERVLDLSEEDAAIVGAFVYYLYNLNYDAALFQENGDHLSLHVQMCIVGDKYDMRPLQDLAIEKFNKLITDTPPNGDDLAKAATCAYDAIGATTEIRKGIVKLAIDQKLIPTEISAEPAHDFERAMQVCLGLCLDIVKVQQSMITQWPKAYYCPSCRTACKHAITLPTTGSVWNCTHCGTGYYGYSWLQSPVA